MPLARYIPETVCTDSLAVAYRHKAYMPHATLRSLTMASSVNNHNPCPHLFMSANSTWTIMLYFVFTRF